MLGLWPCQVMQACCFRCLTPAHSCTGLYAAWPCMTTAQSSVTHVLPAVSQVWTAPVGFIFLSPDWTAWTYFVAVNGIYMLVSEG